MYSLTTWHTHILFIHIPFSCPLPTHSGLFLPNASFSYFQVFYLKITHWVQLGLLHVNGCRVTLYRESRLPVPSPSLFPFICGPDHPPASSLCPQGNCVLCGVCPGHQGSSQVVPRLLEQLRSDHSEAWHQKGSRGLRLSPGYPGRPRAHPAGGSPESVL